MISTYIDLLGSQSLELGSVTHIVIHAVVKLGLGRGCELNMVRLNNVDVHCVSQIKHHRHKLYEENLFTQALLYYSKKAGGRLVIHEQPAVVVAVSDIALWAALPTSNYHGAMCTLEGAVADTPIRMRFIG